MICELCGATVPSTRTVAIEGTVLAVCGNCQKFGVQVAAPAARRSPSDPAIAERLAARARRLETKDVLTALETDEDLAADLPARIRKAREGRGLKQAELAARIQEKASVVAKLESGTLAPDDALLRKLERALGVPLKEKVGKVAAKKYRGPEAVTLGDIVGLDRR